MLGSEQVDVGSIGLDGVEGEQPLLRRQNVRASECEINASHAGKVNSITLWILLTPPENLCVGTKACIK